MAGETSNIAVGPCEVTFNGVALGLTKGGVNVEVATETYVSNVDQYGQAAVDEFIMGRSVTVTVPMVESDLEKLVSVIPGATLVGTTTKKLVVPSGTGKSLRALAKKLICHPVGLPETDKSQDFVVPLAAPKGGFAFSYQLDQERVYEIQFTGYVDLATETLFIMGDEAAVA